MLCIVLPTFVGYRNAKYKWNHVGLDDTTFDHIETGIVASHDATTLGWYSSWLILLEDIELLTDTLVQTQLLNTYTLEYVYNS